MGRRSSNSSLNYKSLEERRMLAGDVTVVENGHLYIRGDELSNQISIVADEPGEIRAAGLRGTTINGRAEPFVVHESIELHVLDYPGRPGDPFDYIEPSGTQADPFKNTNAVLFDENGELGFEPTRWFFNSTNVETLFALRP